MANLNISFFLLILATLFSLSYLVLNLSLFNNNQKLCINTIINLQVSHRKALKKLISLNPKARSLRIERKMALRAIQSAPDPSTKAAATAWLMKVNTAQLSLRGLQYSIIKIGDLETIRVRTLLKRKLFPKSFKLKAKALKFSLSQHPKNSITPNYSLKYNFKKEKLISLETQENLFKKTTTNSFNQYYKNKKVLYKCQATIENTKNKLKEVRLVADKLSLKHLAF